VRTNNEGNEDNETLDRIMDPDPEVEEIVKQGGGGYQAPITGFKLLKRESIELAKLKMPGEHFLIDVEINGYPPGILFNRMHSTVLMPGEKASPEEKPKSGSPRKRKSDDLGPSGTLKSPVPYKLAVEHARRSAYFDGKKGLDFVLPAENVWAMMIAAARKFRPETGAMRAMASAVYVTALDGGSNIPLLDEHGKQYTLDPGQVRIIQRPFQIVNASAVCALVVPTKSSQNKRIITSRFFLPKWRAKWRFHLDKSFFNEEDVFGDDGVFYSMFKLAAVEAGLGVWRPGSPRSPGPYGRFLISGFENFNG
jgi:hypothetical protein